MFVHCITHVFLSLLFNAFIFPIIKNKTEDTSDTNNYRPIALGTAPSKLFEICILDVLETNQLTHDYQIEFKFKHSTDICNFTVKILIKYTDQITPVYTCLLDASKDFDWGNHWKLFAKLIDNHAPLLIVRDLILASNATSLH